MVERNERYSGAELDALGARRRRHSNHRWRAERVARVMMFTEPYGMIAQLFGELGLFEDISVIMRGGAVNLGIVVGIVEQPEFHRSHTLSWDHIEIIGCGRGAATVTAVRRWQAA